MKKKLLCILLIVLFVTPLLYSCKDETQNESTDGSGNADLESIIGLPAKNFGGQELSILTVNEKRGNIYYNYEIASTEPTGDVINEAVYTRTQKIKDDYGIVLDVTYTDNPTTDIKNTILSGDNSYQLICDGIYYLAELGIEGNLRDLNKISTLNLEHPWWDQSALNDLTVAGYTFYLSGDIIVSDKTATWCCFFNKDMVDNYQLEDPYTLVNDGKWTIDKLYEMGKKVSESNKGLPQVTYENGTFGLITQTYDGIASMISFNQKMITKDADDYPILNIQNEETYDKFEKVFNLMTDTNNSLIAEKLESKWSTAVYDKANSAFFSGRGLFQYNKLAYVQKIIDADVEFSYGVLPLPKYDENQEKYYAACTTYMAQFLAIPITVPTADLEIIGYALELMGYYEKELLTPAFYEITMKAKKMDDAQSEEMLDIIFGNKVFDLASVFNYDNALYLYTNIIGSGTNTLASSAESRATAIQKTVDDSIEKFKAIEQ